MRSSIMPSTASCSRSFHILAYRAMYIYRHVRNQTLGAKPQDLGITISELSLHHRTLMTNKSFEVRDENSLSGEMVPKFIYSNTQRTCE
jgi:hypothetical protein